MINRPLFEGQQISLTPIDPEKDAAIESAWTLDLDYTREVREGPARPLGAFTLKKHYEDIQKKAEEYSKEYYFAIRRCSDDALVGMIRIPHIFWTHADAIFSISFGDPEDEERYGTEALELLLQYAFRELNLYRIETVLPAYRAGMIALVEKAGFLMEVRRRRAFYRDGRSWDGLHYGLLADEWQTREREALAL